MTDAQRKQSLNEEHFLLAPLIPVAYWSRFSRRNLLSFHTNEGIV